MIDGEENRQACNCGCILVAARDFVLEEFGFEKVERLAVSQSRGKDGIAISSRTQE